MAAAGQLGLLIADYLALAKESGRRHSDVREVSLKSTPSPRPLELTPECSPQAADKAQQLLKLSRDQALLDLRAGELNWPSSLCSGERES